MIRVFVVNVLLLYYVMIYDTGLLTARLAIERPGGVELVTFS